MDKFEVGDYVWKGRFELKPKKTPCPVCCDTLRVIVVFGDGSEWVVPCQYCAAGFEGPRGWVTEYVREPEADQVRIDAISTLRKGEGLEVEFRSYTTDCSYMRFSSGEIFATRDEALEYAKALAEKARVEEETKATHLKADQTKSYSWNAGYHLREAKRLECQIEHHRRKAVLCKDKAKKGADDGGHDDTPAKG